MMESTNMEQLQPLMSSQLLQKTHPSHAPFPPADSGLPQVSRTPSKPRPWSSIDLKPLALSPSPAFLEPPKVSKDDTCLDQSPVTPKRPSLPARGLSLQMPSRDVSSSSTANLTTNLINRVPLSPKLDSSASYGVPGSVLPRRSRGMDFSRACTNLHHSTLAEQSSPDSSPVIGGRAMNIPSRKSMHNGSMISGIPDSPINGPGFLWSTMAGADKTGTSSSVGSVTMLDSDTGSDSSEADEVMRSADDEDTIYMTPHASKQVGLGMGNPFVTGTTASSGMDIANPFSPAAANFMNFQRARLRRGKSRKSSSSASRRSSMASPGPSSPPLLKSIESSLNGNYFQKDMSRKDVESRRESLSLGTSDLNISDGGESEEGESNRISPNDGLGIPMPVTPTLDERRSVIRRAVTRRGNLLPKPKTFARIRAALMEEGSPIDAECKREAEVIRQVRESDNDHDIGILHSQTTTSTSSPSLLPTTAPPVDTLDDIPETDLTSTDSSHDGRSSSAFSQQALRNTTGPDYWKRFDERMPTPPSSSLFRSSSSVVSDDMSVDNTSTSIFVTPQQPSLPVQHHVRSRSSTPQPCASAIEVTRKIGKRRRDDDLDPHMFKRRAVSPGVSLQNSPILPPSPAQREAGWWSSQPKPGREVPAGHVGGERVSGGSQNGGGCVVGSTKRVGFQGMCDTNDGLMNMSIE